MDTKSPTVLALVLAGGWVGCQYSCVRSESVLSFIGSWDETQVSRFVWHALFTS